MTISRTDEKRRLTRIAVAIQRVDEDTWVVKRQRPRSKVVVVAFPNVECLPDDPGWEQIERRMVAHNNRKLPPVDET